MQYEKAESAFFWDHLNPHRLSVPRYQTAFRQVVWIFFLFGRFPLHRDRAVKLISESLVYSQSVQR